MSTTQALRTAAANLADLALHYGEARLVEAAEAVRAAIAQAEAPQAVPFQVPPYYISGPYAADDTYAVCETDTGRVLRKFRGEADLLLAAGTKTVDISGRQMQVTDVAEAEAKPAGAVQSYRKQLEVFALFDEEGLLEPRRPYSWETLARVAVDLANAALATLQQPTATIPKE